MIKSTIKHALTAVALAASAVGSANAFVISGGDLKITIDGFDIANVGYSPTAGVKCLNDTAACDAASTGLPGMGSVDTAGILSVGSITNAAGTIAYFTRGVDGYLTGVFGGLLDRRVETLCNDDGECTTSIRSVGGFFNCTKTLLSTILLLVQLQPALICWRVFIPVLLVGRST